MDTEFRRIVEEAMEAKKTNLSQISKKEKISTAYLYEVISGKRRLNETLEEKLCKALGIEKKYSLKKGESNAET